MTLETLFSEAARALKATLAAQMGCEPEAYESHTLTVVPRPAGSREPHLALATTCGTGSVLSLRDARLADWARAQPLETHYRIFLPSFLEGLAAQARSLGHAGAKSHSATTGMVLATEPAEPLWPSGFRLRALAAAEQEALRPGRRFENALGEPDELTKISRMREAFAATTEAGELAAVAGIWDQYPGIDEVGLDVAREHRGRGLGALMAREAARRIRRAGRWPIYTYGFTNIRSANTGLAAGFRPLWQIAAVYVPEDVR